MSTPDPITDGELERLRERVKEDLSNPLQAQAWARALQADLPRLLDLCDEAQRKQGDAFAHAIREALERRILRDINGRAALTDDTHMESLSAHVLPAAVIVDCRLRIGRWLGG